MRKPLLSASGTEADGDLDDPVEAPLGDGLEGEGSPIAIAAEADDAAGRVRCRSLDGSWARLRVAECRGIAVVSFADIALINEMEIREVDRELRGLIEGGHRHIILCFDRVVRLSSQVIAMVLNVHRRCTADGGTVKICQIHPDLREIFALTGVFLAIDIYPDLRAALASDWPALPPRQPVSPPPDERDDDPPLRAIGDDCLPMAPDVPPDEPVAAIPLDDLFVAPARPEAPAPRPSPSPRPATLRQESRNGSHPERAEASGPRPAPPAPTPARDDEPPRPGPAAARVRLIARVGRAQGQAIEIPPPRFLIGRDTSCQLRAHSPIVSRFHALIEQRDGRVFLRDLGSSNGTILEGRTLQSHEEVEVADAQRLQIGPMLFTFAVDPVVVSAPAVVLTGPVPIPSVTPVALSQHPHVHPLIQCPQCGIDGWFSVDQLLLAIARAISLPPLVASAQAPALGMSPEVQPSTPSEVIPFAHRNGHVGAGAHSTTPIGPREHAVFPAATAHGAIAHRNGHVQAGAHPAAAGAPLGHAVSPAATSHHGTANGRGYAPVAGSSGVAVPHTLGPGGGGIPTSPSMPRLPGAPTWAGSSPATPPGRVPPAAPAYQDPEFSEVLDLLASEVADAPTLELGTRTLPASLAPRALDIDFRCPECGTEVLVPVDRIDQQLQCPGCKSQLYSDSGGGLVVGDIADRPRGPNAFEDDGPDYLGRVIDGWKALPRLVRIGLSSAAAVLLLALVQWVVTAPRLPASLKDRAIFVAEAFAHEDYRGLRAIAAPGSSKGLSRWMEQVRPRFWRGKIQKVWVKVHVEQQDKKKGKATLVAHVSAITGASRSGAVKRPSSLALEIRSGSAAAPSTPAAGADNRKIDLRLFWVMGRDGQWLFDANQTGAAGQPSKSVPDDPDQPERPGQPSPRDLN